MVELDLNQTEQIFIALENLDRLSQHANTPIIKKLTIQDLFQFVHTPSFQPTSSFYTRLENDEIAQQNLQHLLETDPLIRFPFAIAASSGEIDIRTEGNFTISLHPSTSHPDQVYLKIIAHTYLAEPPKFLFVRLEGQVPLRLIINDFYDGEAQILLNSSDEIVKHLRNHKSDVILRL